MCKDVYLLILMYNLIDFIFLHFHSSIVALTIEILAKITSVAMTETLKLCSKKDMLLGKIHLSVAWHLKCGFI